ncbi:MAG: metal ABC transporter substrate-binding protein [Actinomycetota bacterium]|nr:metal ABC transporter substrate-binding protein [Actinomycetota bacterium]
MPRVVAVLLITVACGNSSSDGGGPVAVVASFYPLAEVARQVGGDHVRVTDLTPPGAEPHDLELTSDQVDALEDAEVLLYLGGGFQPAVEAVVERSRGQAVDLLSELPADDDPHVWLDPTQMARVVDLTETALREADPAGADVFAANANGYRDRVAALDAEYRAGLAQCQRRVLVTAHDAFAHLARRYGLTVESISGLSPEAEPDPRRIAELSDLVRRQGATTVFTETLVPPDVADTLAREAGVRTAILDPIEGLSEEQVSGGESYISVMQQNLATLREALGCT